MMDMNDNLGYVFSDSLIDVISTFSGFFVSVISEEEDDSFDDITCVMSLNGTKNGVFFLSASEPDVRVLCSSILGVPQAEIQNDDIEDSMCELVNMVAGSARLRLSETDFMFTITTPFIFKGENMTLFTKNKIHIISKKFGNGEISLKLKIIY